MRARRLLALLLAPLAGLLVGCQDDLPQATEIERMRVLGAQVSVVGDETRATPEPGDVVNVTMPIVFPSTSDSGAGVRALIIGCTAPTRFTGGLPICQEFIDLAASGQDLTASLPDIEGDIDCTRIQHTPGDLLRSGALSVQCVNAAANGDTTFTLDVPAGFEADAMLFRGIVCEDGEPLIDPEDPLLFLCKDGDGEGIQVHGTVPVSHRRAETNHNPDLDGLTVLRETVPWPAYDPEELPPQDDCDESVPHDDPVVHSVVTGEHRITLRYDADALEQSQGEPEDLEITVYATLGEMERRFTLFEGSTPNEDGVLESDLFWDPPKVNELLADGADPDAEEPEEVKSKLVRFFITLRDQRGGFAMTSRAVCLR